MNTTTTALASRPSTASDHGLPVSARGSVQSASLVPRMGVGFGSPATANAARATVASTAERMVVSLQKRTLRHRVSRVRPAFLERGYPAYAPTGVRVCSGSPSPRYSGERGWGEGFVV